MTTKTIAKLFDEFQKAKLHFAKSVAELALRPINVPILEEANVLELIKPLLNDVNKNVQQSATLASGRIVQYDAKIAANFINSGCLGVLLQNSNKENKHHKSSMLFVLRSICKHSPELANYMVNSGVMPIVLRGMEDFEPSVQEMAAWTIGYIARHDALLAHKCVEHGCVPLLIMYLQGPNLCLKQVAANTLHDIAKHSLELAQNIVDAGGIPYLAKNLSNMDEKLKRHVLAALCACAKHSAELAEAVVEADVFPSVFIHMAHSCPMVRKQAATLVRDVVKHTLELTQLVVTTGGVGAIMQALNEDGGEARIPCITALGFIGGHSSQLALSVLGCNAILTLGTILKESHDENLLAVTVWALGQIGKHTPEHSKAVGAANLFPVLVNLYRCPGTSDDLKFKCKIAMKLCLQKCLLVSAMEPLLYDAPPNILKYVLGQYSKILPNDPKARRLFVTTGGLKRMQLIEAQPGSTLMEYITIVNACFPEEIVRFYSPGYPETLLERVEQYEPQVMSVLHETEMKQGSTQLLSMSSVSDDLRNILS